MTVIGHAPAWLTNVRHFPIEDIGKNPIANVMFKLSQASCYLPESFILMNDDFFVMKPVEELPILHLGPMAPKLKTLHKGNPYTEGFRATYDVLKQLNIEEPLNFGVHTPFPMERQKLWDLPAITQWTSGKVLLKTIYGNLYYRERATLAAADVKTNVWNGKRIFWSTPTNLLPVAQVTLQRRFPRRCVYEKA